MAKGISLHIGINQVNPDHYSGYLNPLNAPENDAIAMFDIALAERYECGALLGKNATRRSVIDGIRYAADRLSEGDVFLITFSGHGGQQLEHFGFEVDMLNETWCLYDGQLVDDELYQLWKHFVPGVRIIMFSDSCNSGTVAKMHGFPFAGAYGVKALPDWVSDAVVRDQKEFYKSISADVRAEKQSFSGNKEDFSGLLIAACEDGSNAYDGPKYSLFTEALLHVWDEGRFDGGYRDFFWRISSRLQEQKPNYFRFGHRVWHFDGARPFQI